MFPAIMMGAMAGMQVLSGFMGAQQEAAAGKYQKKVAQYQSRMAEGQAMAEEQQAGQELAASQRDVMAQRYQSNLALGRTRALAAASGVSLASPTITQGMSDLARFGDYNAEMAKYSGQSKAQSLLYGAKMTRLGAQNFLTQGKAAEALAGGRGIMDIMGGIGQGAMMGTQAAGMAGLFNTPTPTETPIQQSPSGNLSMGGYQMGNFYDTPSMLQQGSPMYVRYGAGGP